MTHKNPYVDEMPFGPKELEAYLDRINYRGPLKPDLETLTALQHTHLLALPFENLDIHMERPIEIDVEKAFHKIIKQKRGGFCYELNILYGALLAAIGFTVEVLEGRVVRNGGQGIRFGHLMNLVHLEEPYVTDVGFGGGGSFAPFPLRIEEMFKNDAGKFLLTKSGDTYHFQSFSPAFTLEPQILFDIEPKSLSEFYDACAWTQTADESGFKKHVIVIKPLANGQMQTLIGLDYWKEDYPQGNQRTLTYDQRIQVLEEDFGIDLEGSKLKDPSKRI